MIQDAKNIETNFSHTQKETTTKKENLKKKREKF
jgi:hypothetical protein